MVTPFLITKYCFTLVKTLLLESWKVVAQRLWVKEIGRGWFWRRLLRVSSLDCKEIQPVHPKGNQSRIFIGSNDWCWSWNSNTLMRRTDSLEKTLMLGKTEGRRRREPQRMRWLNAITDLMDMEFVMDRKACSAAVHGVAKSQTQPSDYTELLKGYKLSVIREWPVAGRGTPSRAWEWALVYTRKWIVRGDTRADKGRDYWEGAPGKREEGWGTQENCSAACSQS